MIKLLFVCHGNICRSTLAQSDSAPPVSRRVFSCPRLSVRSQTMHTLFQRIYKKNIAFFVGFVNQFFKPFTQRTSFHTFAPRCGQ